MATTKVSEMKRVEGIFDCAQMPGETASLTKTAEPTCALLREIFSAHQEDMRRAEKGGKPTSPYSAHPLLRRMFRADQERKKAALTARTAAGEKTERKDSTERERACFKCKSGNRFCFGRMFWEAERKKREVK